MATPTKFILYIYFLCTYVTQNQQKQEKKRYFTLYYIRQRIPKKETTEKISGCIEGVRVRLETMSGKVQADDPLR